MTANPLQFLAVETHEMSDLASSLISAVMQEFLTEDQFVSYAGFNPATDQVWVIKVNGGVIAAAVLRKISGKARIRELRGVVVARSWRRAGIGTFMLSKLQEYARKNDISHFLVKLNRKMEEACFFFEKNAFVSTGQENDGEEFIVALKL